MPEIDFEQPLDDALEEWLRMRFTTVGGRVVTYTVQYETTVNGLRAAVMRFDNAHGFPHRDRLDRHGRVTEKRVIPGNPEPGEALTQGQRDIRINWQQYRAAYFGEEA